MREFVRKKGRKTLFIEYDLAIVGLPFSQPFRFYFDMY